MNARLASPAEASQNGMASARPAETVVILSYANAGAERLRSLLAGRPELACTSGTGLLPLCEQAAFTWQQVEERDGPLSALAAASIRALAGSAVTSLLAQTGKSRWCETAMASPHSAETFLELFPDTKFLCLHRNCTDVIDAAIQENPWGLSGPSLAPFVATHPGNSVAAVAAYWASRTESLLAFEEAHPGACHRVRREDLGGNPDQTASEICGFLRLDGNLGAAPSWLSTDSTDASGDRAQDRAQIPADRIPAPLIGPLNGLLTRLGYTPLE